MRLIKFRGWDTINKHYVDNLSIHWDGDIGWNFREGDIKNVNRNQIIIEQFTGILDSQDIEIYECDVIKGGKIVGMITWNEDMSCYQVEYEWSKNQHTEQLTCDLVIEVIGNIHENSELLKYNERTL
jgi:hypothetical protein